MVCVAFIVLSVFSSVFVNSISASPICGNNICEEGEANDPGGCGPNADSRCLGPPARQGTCPQDCDNKTLPDKNKTKILPEVASLRARERLGELNFTIQLKEVGKGNDARFVYELTGNKEGKFLGIFKIMARVQAQVDAESGDIKVIKPWWSFLASGI